MATLFTAADVMDDSAVLLNDAGQSLYDYTVQLPFLRMVMRDIEQELDLAGFQLNMISEYTVVVSANATTITYPDNFFIPISISERKSGSTDAYVPMKQVNDVNGLGLAQAGASLIYWDWRHNCLNVYGATEDRQIRLLYWRFLTEFIDEDSIGDIRGGRNMLSYFTAAMCARFIGQNKDLSQDLRALGGDASERFLHQVAKSNQAKRVRRKPFRVGYRGYSSMFARIPN